MTQMKLESGLHNKTSIIISESYIKCANNANIWQSMIDNMSDSSNWHSSFDKRCDTDDVSCTV